VNRKGEGSKSKQEELLQPVGEAKEKIEMQFSTRRHMDQGLRCANQETQTQNSKRREQNTVSIVSVNAKGGRKGPPDARYNS
jgi:hypothetical protein